jgi:uncharacterized membrane protein
VRFAVALPLWGYVAVFAVALGCAWLTYARVQVQLTRGQRLLLTGLRAATLVLIVFFLLRPVTFAQAAGARDSLVAILVDVSRSMRLADIGTPRIERARELARDLQTQIGADFRTELLTFGESLGRAEPAQLTADARRSDLSGALAALADRYRGQRLAGVVVVSDGGDTAAQEAGTSRRLNVPVFTVGVGNSAIGRDREVINLTAGEPLLAESSVDLSVSATSAGFRAQSMELRLTANGRPIETRHVTPPADGGPIHEVFTVSPSADSATVYAVEIPVEPGELANENNVRRVLVPPQGRRRRILIVEGAPGFEHTFLKRALARDQALEVDSVVRKGQNDEGRDTFFIQAAASRSGALAAGYPVKRAELFVYDAVIFGNIAGDFFSRDQLEMTSGFVATRGGGLLVLGARSFERAGLLGTALEEVLPLDLTDRRAALARTAGGAVPAQNALALTADGTTHPATRLGVTIDETRKRWAQLPPLASVTAAGSPRPGAQVLAVSSGPGGELRPLLATQRYGLGRAMVFAGEASWRWRMFLPSANTTHELVWRQLARWLAAGAAEAIELPPTSVALPGTTEAVSVLVRDEEFEPIGNAEVTVRVKDPGGVERSMPAALANPREGRYAASVRFDQAGVYQIAADVRRSSQPLGSVTRSTLVGGSDVELSEPRLNESVLRRIAETTGGQYVPADQAASVPALLRTSGIGNPPTEMRDLWHNGYSLLAIVALLACEWMLRRRVGLA